MDLISTIQDLIRFKTITGNEAEIKKAAEYIVNKFAGTSIKAEIFQSTASPVVFLRNCDGVEFDVLILGHIDVVPAEDKMFEPIIKDGKMFGRGTLDMKSFAAVAMNSMEYAGLHNLPLKFGVVLSTDEEKGSKSTESFLKNYPNIIDSQICKLVGTTKPTINKIRNGEYTNMADLKPKNPVAIGLCDEKALENALAISQSRNQPKPKKTIFGTQL